MRTYILASILCTTLIACGGSSDGSDDEDVVLGPILIHEVTLSGIADKKTELRAVIDPVDRAVKAAEENSSEESPYEWSLQFILAEHFEGYDLSDGVEIELISVDDLNNERIFTTYIEVE
ncbi:MAG: hypothetical protein EA401_09865 [Planctomycetota bacterium]|nr:MAG: hypothetical protein EA401_09865 [Planctomycetota bacterium]